MTPNYNAFMDELALIKRAAEEEKKKHQSDFWPLAKSRLGSAAKFGLGAGLGAGAGALAGEGLRHVWKSSTPAQRRIAGAGVGGAGMIASLALWDAMQEAARREEAVLKKKKEANALTGYGPPAGIGPAMPSLPTMKAPVATGAVSKSMGGETSPGAPAQAGAQQGNIGGGAGQ